MHRFRLWLANVPVLSLLLWRWQVLYGSTVVDYAHSRRVAERRAGNFARVSVLRWNSTTVERAGWRREGSSA